MIYEPSKYVLQAVNAKLVQLGYSLVGTVYPRFEVYSFDTTPSGEKGQTMWDCTFIMEAITNSTSPGPSLDMIENIKGYFSETFTISHFKIDIWIWEICSGFEEISETDFHIWRQTQRVRLKLTQI